jgi:hypothetical protein
MTLTLRLEQNGRALAMRLLVSIALVLTCRSSARAQPAVIGATIPDAIHFAPELRPYVQRLLERSPTFRDQCHRLARASNLYVRVRREMRMNEAAFQAHSVIERSTDGGLVALVDIRAFGDPTEWLAHELEHVIEQIEGVKLQKLVGRDSNVWRSGVDSYETGRAIRAGHAALAEMRRADRPAAHAAVAHLVGAGALD